MIKKIFILCFMIFFSVQSAMASSLPDNLWKYIKDNLPNAKQRFDSVIELPSGTLYIPLYPAMRSDVDEISIEYAYPKTTSLKALPEVVTFNDNFSLLKVFKDKNGNYSITKNENLPLKVRLGVMPQDMLVPPGLQIPDSLKILLGDLVIPSKNEGSIGLDETDLFSDRDKKLAQHRNLSKNIKPIAEFKNKKLLVSSYNSKFISVYDIGKSDTLYELKLTSLPYKIVSSNSSKFALILYFANNNIEILDLKNERIITTINLTTPPKDVQIDEANNLAYISQPDADLISVIDMNSAKLVKEIKLTQSPSKISLNPDSTSLVFVDQKTQKLYSLVFGEEYVAKYIADTINPSKLFYFEDKIYVISRTENKMFAYSAIDGNLISETILDEKPVDALLVDRKIFILCSKAANINTYDIDQDKIVVKTKLPNEGFYSRVNKIPNAKSIYITGIGTDNFVLFDTLNSKIIKNQPFFFDVGNIVMVEK